MIDDRTSKLGLSNVPITPFFLDEGDSPSVPHSTPFIPAGDRVCYLDSDSPLLAAQVANLVLKSSQSGAPDQHLDLNRSLSLKI
jgi:hypothetical protein